MQQGNFRIKEEEEKIDSKMPEIGDMDGVMSDT